MLHPPLTIVVPIFNEIGALPRAVGRLGALLAKLPEGSELLLVDDGSTDGSGEFLAGLAEVPGRRVLRHARNRGYGAALKTGVRAAGNPVVAITDADGTYPLGKIPELAQAMTREDAAMAVGARPMRQVAAIRRPAKTALRWLAEYLTGQPIPDLNSGLRVFRREDALRLVRLLPDGFSFTTTITMALMTEGERVVFLPITYRTRTGTSKIRPIRDTAGFAMLILRTTLAFHPMKVFGPVGFGLMGLGALLLLLRMVLDKPFGLATTITLLVGGFQILALGLLADLVNRRGT